MRKGSAESYRVFVRDWWRWEYSPLSTFGLRAQERRLVPYPDAPKHTLAKGMTEEEARAMCAEYRSTHEPGPLSRKAEYERE